MLSLLEFSYTKGRRSSETFCWNLNLHIDILHYYGCELRITVSRPVYSPESVDMLSSFLSIFIYNIYKTDLKYTLTFFNWSIIAVQCCFSFCYTTALVSYIYMYIPSLLSLPPTPPPAHPSRSSQSTRVSSLWYRAASH